MGTRTIRQSVTFKVIPLDVCEAIMDSHKHAEFTGADVKMSRKVGGKFSVYGGEIEGTNLELIPGQKIVPSWRYSNWPPGVFSTATFSLQAVPGGARLTFIQTGVPEDVYADISQGWRDYYWQPMKEMFKTQQSAAG